MVQSQHFPLLMTGAREEMFDKWRDLPNVRNMGNNSDRNMRGKTMTGREDLPKAFKHNTSISANKTIACHDRCISCVGLDREESVGHVGAEGVADQRDRLRGCWQQSILVGAKGRDELGENRDLDIYLVDPARYPVLRLVIWWDWDAGKGEILIRDTDTKTIIEED